MRLSRRSGSWNGTPVLPDPGTLKWRRQMSSSILPVRRSQMGRWTDARKRLLVESRILSTRLLVDALAGRSASLPLLISASGIGYYGPSDDRLLDEASSIGQGFLAELSAAWEAEALRAGQLGTRVVLLRTGMVLEQGGGALPKMLLPFRLFAGGPVLAWHAMGVMDSPVRSHRILIQWVIATATDLRSCECSGA
jgi:hypothetical protein